MRLSIVAKKICRKYGTSPIQRNWNRLSELTYKWKLTAADEAEIKYRIAVQNQYATTQKLDADFIEPK